MENFMRALRRSRMRVRRDRDDNGFLKLFVSKRLIHGAAVALLGIFVPIFIYKTTGQHFYVVGLFYALLSILYAVFLVPGMYVANRIGFSRALVLGGAFSVIFYVIMYYVTSENFWNFLPLIIIAVLGFRIFHWVPFHVDFTLFTKAGERGRQVSLSFATIAFLGIIGPISAGFIIEHAGYEALFATAVALLIAATISYAFVPETSTQFEWGYIETWKKLFSKEARGMAVGEFANGAEVIVNVIVWPIFLFEVLDGDVLEIGAVSTVVVGATIIIQLFLGRYLDKEANSKERTLRIGSSLYAIGWILKMFILSAAHVFFVGLYHNIVKIFTKTPFSAIIYDMTAEQGKYVDEYTVIREMAAHAGRAFSLIVILVLSLFVSIEWAFVIAAIASVALNMVYRLESR